jgi:hypothetical protein
MLSYVIQLCWSVSEENKEPLVVIREYLNKLSEIVVLGLDAYELKGKRCPGYYLERKK